jgi:hypothetical protein
MVKVVAVAAGLLVGAVSLGARAQTAPQPNAVPPALAPAPPASAPRPLPAQPALHHVPVTTAAERAPLHVAAAIDRPDLVRRAVLVYAQGDHVEEVPFERSAGDALPYVAVVPADRVVRPRIAYAIEIEQTDGQRVPVFASRADMQPVQVVGDEVDAREEALLARLQGRRFVLDTGGEWASFGPSTAKVCPGACAPAGATQTTVPRSILDNYWHLDVGVTYRLLRTVSEIGIRGGMVRGTSVVPNVTDPSQFNVGLNYGAAWIRIRATDWLHLEAETLSSITEVGFSLGGGGSVLVGDEYASHLTVGLESVQVFGTRGFSRFDIVANDRLRLAPIVEVTDMPHAASAGVRLLMEVGYDLQGGWLVTVRGGYQARIFDSGGPAAGAGLAYAF